MVELDNADFTDELIRNLHPSAEKRETILKYLQSRKIIGKGQVFSEFLKILSDVDMPEPEARFHIDQILAHTKKLETAAGREIGFCVGMLDYLLNINPKLDCPKIIELGTYTKMLSQTTIDGLTGIFNRRYFDQQMINELGRCKRHNYTFSLLIMDIDDFKRVNDVHGHQAGDMVLQDFSNLIKDHLRSEDVAARYGGEEFAVILPHTDLEGAEIFSRRLLEKTRAREYVNDISVTFSGGIANFPLHGSTVSELIETADKGLYESKLRGKNQISVKQLERRDNTRYSVDDKLLFATGSNTLHSGILQNISLTGLAGMCSVALQPGELITLKADHDVNAQIVWTYTGRQENNTHFGVRYNSQDRNTLNELMTRYITDEGTHSSDDLSSDLFE